MHSFFVALIAVVVILNLVVFFGRVVPGPSVFDRLIGIGVIGSNSIILLLLMGALAGRMDMYVDVSIAYAAIGFITLVALAKYFKYKGDLEQ